LSPKKKPPTAPPPITQGAAVAATNGVAIPPLITHTPIAAAHPTQAQIPFQIPIVI